MKVLGVVLFVMALTIFLAAVLGGCSGSESPTARRRRRRLASNLWLWDQPGSSTLAGISLPDSHPLHRGGSAPDPVARPAR